MRYSIACVFAMILAAGAKAQVPLPRGDVSSDSIGFMVGSKISVLNSPIYERWTQGAKLTAVFPDRIVIAAGTKTAVIMLASVAAYYFDAAKPGEIVIVMANQGK